MKQIVWTDPWFFVSALVAGKALVRCPITGHSCEGDLSHLCEEYGCAHKGGLSPHTKGNS